MSFQDRGWSFSTLEFLSEPIEEYMINGQGRCRQNIMGALCSDDSITGSDLNDYATGLFNPGMLLAVLHPEVTRLVRIHSSRSEACIALHSPASITVAR